MSSNTLNKQTRELIPFSGVPNSRLESLDENKLNKTGDSKDNTTTFTSGDTTDANATSWTNVTTLASGEKHSSIFAKVSQMFKNVRYLYKLLGTTDVSSFFGGSNQDITGVLSTLNNHIGSHTVAKDVPSDAVFTDHTYNGNNLNTSTSKTGSGTTVTDTIASGTSMNSAIGTLLNNDAALNSALTSLSNKKFTYIGHPMFVLNDYFEFNSPPSELLICLYDSNSNCIRITSVIPYGYFSSLAYFEVNTYIDKRYYVRFQYTTNTNKLTLLDVSGLSTYANQVLVYYK